MTHVLIDIQCMAICLQSRSLALYCVGACCTMPFNCSCICLAGETACPPFEHDNRAGIDGMLHSIIAIRDRGTAHNVIGLTFRIGRHVPGKYNLLTAFVTYVN